MGPVHDLGGRLGFGPVPVGDNLIFHADWERRAFALTQLAQGASGFNTDAFRHGIERERAELYASCSYFDKWIRNAERMLVEGGVIAADAVSAQMAGVAATGVAARSTAAQPPAGRGALRLVEPAPKYKVGAHVRVVDTGARTGHTRRPSYVAGHVGQVEIVNQSWIFPDTHAHGQGEAPTWVYAVKFDAAVLWPDDGMTHGVCVDLFEPYLQPV